MTLFFYPPWPQKGSFPANTTSENSSTVFCTNDIVLVGRWLTCFLVSALFGWNVLSEDLLVGSWERQEFLCNSVSSKVFCGSFVIISSCLQLFAQPSQCQCQRRRSVNKKKFEKKKKLGLHCVWTQDAAASWASFFFFVTCLPYEVPRCIFSNFFSDVSQRHVRKPTYNLNRKKNAYIHMYETTVIVPASPSAPEPAAQQRACLFLHCPLVATERSYQKNAVSISSKLFPFSSLSQC